MLSLWRKLPQQIRQFDTFNRDGLCGRECKDKTMLVVGVGNVGSETVRLMTGMGMKVLGVDLVPVEIASAAEAAGGDLTARSFQERKAEAERRIIVAALERNDWHITRTAAELGLADHASLLKIMRRHDLRKP